MIPRGQDFIFPRSFWDFGGASRFRLTRRQFTGRSARGSEQFVSQLDFVLVEAAPGLHSVRSVQNLQTQFEESNSKNDSLHTKYEGIFSNRYRKI